MKCRFIIAMFCFLSLASCGDNEPTEPEVADMSGKGLAPWHMWGNSQSINLVYGTGIITTTSQLTRITYKRPETWHWLFVVTPVQGQIVHNFDCVIDFSVTVGVGRSSVTLPTFSTFYISTAVPYGSVLYTTTAQGPVIDSRVVPPPANQIDSLVAQDIQLQANITYHAAFPGDDLSLKIEAYWSPESHIRPDWFQGNFLGSEDGGT